MPGSTGIIHRNRNIQFGSINEDPLRVVLTNNLIVHHCILPMTIAFSVRYDSFNLYLCFFSSNSFRKEIIDYCPFCGLTFHSITVTEEEKEKEWILR